MPHPTPPETPPIPPIVNELKPFPPTSLHRAAALQLEMARRLLYYGRGRVISGSDWVKAPTQIIVYLPCGANHMTWTKPEAEVVAVTMEVTAYVAML